jgi:Pvc16 N-terminal domain
MSDQLGLAALTHTLRVVLSDAIAEPVPGASVTVGPPAAEAGGAAHSSRVNLFLLRTRPNAAWRNADVVDVVEGVDQRPEARSFDRRSVLPLDVQYLVSFYGDAAQLVPERLYGVAAALWHRSPRLTAHDVTAALATSPALLASGLARDIAERQPVRLSALDLDLEELSRLWGLFPQVPYAPSMVVEASVLLIQPDAPRTSRVVREVAVSAATLPGAADTDTDKDTHTTASGGAP